MRLDESLLAAWASGPGNGRLDLAGLEVDQALLDELIAVDIERVSFGDARFVGPIDFGGVHLHGSIGMSLFQAVFDHSVSFVGSNLSARRNFNLKRLWCRGDVDLSGVDFGAQGSARLSFSHVGGSLDLTGAKLPPVAWIGGEHEYARSVFAGDVILRDAVLGSERTELVGASFEGVVDFDGAVIPEDSVLEFRQVSFGSGVRVENLAKPGAIDVVDSEPAEVAQLATEPGAFGYTSAVSAPPVRSALSKEFSAWVQGDEVLTLEGLVVDQALVDDLIAVDMSRVRFDRAQFVGPIDFAGAHYQRPRRFRGSVIHKSVFHDSVSFAGVTVAEGASFQLDEVSCRGDVDVAGADFAEAGVKLSFSSVGGGIDLTGARFALGLSLSASGDAAAHGIAGDVSLRDTVLGGQIVVGGRSRYSAMIFEGVVDFDGAVIAEGAVLWLRGAEFVGGLRLENLAQPGAIRVEECEPAEVAQLATPFLAFGYRDPKRPFTVRLAGSDAVFGCRDKRIVEQLRKKLRTCDTKLTKLRDTSAEVIESAQGLIKVEELGQREWHAAATGWSEVGEFLTALQRGPAWVGTINEVNAKFDMPNSSTPLFVVGDERGVWLYRFVDVETNEFFSPAGVAGSEFTFVELGPESGVWVAEEFVMEPSVAAEVARQFHSGQDMNSVRVPKLVKRSS